MKILAVVPCFSLASLLAGSVGAQMPAEGVPPALAQMPQVQQVVPQIPPPADPSQSDAQAADGPLPLPDVYQPPPEGSYDANAYPATADVGADEAVAQSYDDGYDPQAYEQFQDSLAPYGTWTDDATYGRVWSPDAATVGADFVPYVSGGRWLLSEYGWTWISSWNWGWAPFHYGRWTVVANRGWCWVPGSIWGPAWVSWRSGSGYVGWAALPPHGVHLAASFGARSPWRFTTAAGLGAARPAFLSSRYAPALFARTSIVSNDRLLTHGQWSAHVNAGPIRGAGVTPVRLSTFAPRTLPRVSVLPRPGVSMAERPWTHAPASFGRSAYNPSYQRTAVAQRSPAAAYRAAPSVGEYRPGAGVARPLATQSYTPRPYANPMSYGRPYTPSTSASSAPRATSTYAYRPQPSYHAFQPTYRAPAPAAHFEPPAARGGGFGSSASHFGSFGGGGHVGGFSGGGHVGGFNGGGHVGGFGGGGHRR